MRIALPKICAATALLATSGCALMGASSPPITLQQALVQTVDALSAAHVEAQTKGVVGYYPCTLSATFDVQAVTSVSGSVALAVAPSASSLTGSLSGANSTTQGNEVTVLLASTMCAPAVALKSVNTDGQQPAAPTPQPFMAPRPQG